MEFVWAYQWWTYGTIGVSTSLGYATRIEAAKACAEAAARWEYPRSNDHGFCVIQVPRYRVDGMAVAAFAEMWGAIGKRAAGDAACAKEAA